MEDDIGSSSQQTKSDDSNDDGHSEEKVGPSHTEAAKMFKNLMLYTE